MSLLGKLFGRDGKQGPAPGLLPIDPEADVPPDIEALERIEQLLVVPPEQRDVNWQHAFFSAFWSAAVEVPSNEPFIGPDGFPYLRLNQPQSRNFTAHNLASLARPCLEAGSGAVLFPSADAADPAYVVPMGVIESLVRYRDWRGEPSERQEAEGAPRDGTVTLKAGTKIIQATPSQAYLSRDAAKALDRHLRDIWKVDVPRALLLSSPAMRPSNSLVVNVSRSAFETDAHAQNFAQAVLWHLPPSRSVMFMPDDMAEADMTPLAELAGD